MQIIKDNYAPIVLFVYNRPEHTGKTLSALQKNDLACRSKLFIFSDGPKPDVCSREKIAEVRKVIEKASGFGEVTIIERERNKGLANSIIEGVTDIVDRYGRVIVLEDDLETSPDFLRFMNKALDVYVDEPQVMQISGHMFDVDIKAETDACFLPFTTSWGWATWKRAWDHFDPFMSGHEKIRNVSQLKNQFNLDGTYGYFEMLEKQLHGKIDSWAIRWYLSVFIKNGLTLFPIKSLVRNIGFDGSGTHYTSESNINPRPYRRLNRKNIYFPEIDINTEYYNKVKVYLAHESKEKKQNMSVIRRFNIGKIIKKIREIRNGFFMG